MKDNLDQLEAANAMVAAYQKETNLSDKDKTVSYMLCELMHYCKANNIDFEEQLQNGRFHFQFE